LKNYIVLVRFTDEGRSNLQTYSNRNEDDKSSHSKEQRVAIATTCRTQTEESILRFFSEIRSSRKEIKWLQTRVEQLEKENERHKKMFVNMRDKHEELKRKLKDILDDA